MIKRSQEIIETCIYLWLYFMKDILDSLFYEGYFMNDKLIFQAIFITKILRSSSPTFRRSFIFIYLFIYVLIYCNK